MESRKGLEVILFPSGDEGICAAPCTCMHRASHIGAWAVSGYCFLFE